MPSVWLITGCSSGFGREIAIAAAKRGDTVVATSRNTSKLRELEAAGNVIPMRLDVCASDEEVQAIVADVLKTVGHIDILVNNAGYILQGTVEECSASEAEAHFQTNFFGQLRVLRAVLPSMRERQSGVIASMGSIGGWKGEPVAGLYCASKAAVAMYTEGLRAELAPFSIQVTCIEPGYFRTNFLNPAGDHRVIAQKRIEAYSSGTQGIRSALDAYNNHQPGDPVKGAQLIVEALTKSGRCEGRILPPRLALGRDAVGYIGQSMAQMREALDSWQDLVASTDCDDVVASQ